MEDRVDGILIGSLWKLLLVGAVSSGILACAIVGLLQMLLGKELFEPFSWGKRSNDKFIRLIRTNKSGIDGVDEKISSDGFDGLSRDECVTDCIECLLDEFQPDDLRVYCAGLLCKFAKPADIDMAEIEYVLESSDTSNVLRGAVLEMIVEVDLRIEESVLANVKTKCIDEPLCAKPFKMATATLVMAK